jgi:TRAP-type mannitol/chloroaromatic compound transport system substrate-binding protein
LIDAAEFAGAHDDMKLGLHRTARYYYASWQEARNTSEFSFNKKAYEAALPIDLQRTLDHAVVAVQIYRRTDYHTKNAIALERL